jgi:hypothetical protein
MRAPTRYFLSASTQGSSWICLRPSETRSDADLVADAEHLGRVPEATPRHVRDVQQAVDAAEVDERAVLGDVLDRAVEDRALGQLGQRLLLERVALLLEELAAREDDVVPALVELDDAEARLLADQLVEVADRPEVDLRAREERRDADVDLEAALDPPGDDALDHGGLVVGLLDVDPDAALVGAPLGEQREAVVAFLLVDEDVDLVPDLHLPLAADERELVDADHAFGLEADVDDDVVALHGDDRPADDLALTDFVGDRLREQVGEGHVVLLGAGVGLGLGHLSFFLEASRQSDCAAPQRPLPD